VITLGAPRAGERDLEQRARREGERALVAHGGGVVELQDLVVRALRAPQLSVVRRGPEEQVEQGEAAPVEARVERRLGRLDRAPRGIVDVEERERFGRGHPARGARERVVGGACAPAVEARGRGGLDGGDRA